jgi:lysine 2,3-aminomutase
MRAFVSCKIKPHYLHHPDLVAGTRHFRLSLESGRALVGQLHHTLPETHRPTYILDIPGGAGKVSLLSDRVQKAEHGWLVENDKGERYVYDDAD